MPVLPDGHVVVEDGTITGANRIDSLHLEGVAFEVVHGATENVVRFAFEFGGGMRGTLFGRESVSVEAVRSRLAFGVFLNQLNIGAGERDRLRLILKPAAWREQDENDDDDYHHVIGPATALIGPENRVDEAAPELLHTSERWRRPRPARRACGGRDDRRRRPRDCG
jgi:hypothetical protein